MYFRGIYIEEYIKRNTLAKEKNRIEANVVNIEIIELGVGLIFLLLLLSLFWYSSQNFHEHF
jgi:hypothetical protein